MKIRVFIKIETVDVLLAKKNKGPEWLAKEIARAMSMSSYYTMKMVRGEKPVSPEVRNRVMQVFRGMGVRQGRPTWDDFFRIEEAA